MGSKTKSNSDNYAFANHKAAESESDADDRQPRVQFVSPIAQPILQDKMFERGLKLLKRSVAYEHSLKVDGKSIKSTDRQLKRGVAEVTKSIRKGQKGVVFIASDIYPIDIVAHLPVFCEDQHVLYCFISNRKVLGAACKTKRPASVIMVIQPKDPESSNADLYNKFTSALKEEHPFF